MLHKSKSWIVKLLNCHGKKTRVTQLFQFSEFNLSIY